MSRPRPQEAPELAVLGRRIFEVIAPDVADEFEGKALATLEAAALRRTMLVMREDDEGTCHGRFRIPTLHGHILRKMLLAISSPTRHVAGRAASTTVGSGATDDVAAAGGAGDADATTTTAAKTSGSTGIDPDLPSSVRHGLALCELLEAIPAKGLPQAGGRSVAVVVTMTKEQLLAGLRQHGVCDLDTGAQLTTGEARRLACTAGIIPPFSVASPRSSTSDAEDDSTAQPNDSP